MKISSTCTACDTMCRCLGFLFLNSGSSTGSRLTSRKVWHPPWDMTRVPSSATRASARGTGASASALMDSTSSSGSELSPTRLPMGGDGVAVSRCTALFTSAANTCGWPPARIAVMTPPWCARSPANAASTLSASSTTAGGHPPSPSSLSILSSSATNSGEDSLMNCSPCSSPPAAVSSLCRSTQNAHSRICVAIAAPRIVAASFASRTLAYNVNLSSSGTPCLLTSSDAVSIGDPARTSSAMSLVAPSPSL
mmetsp:Transcript_6445/g.24969  ORF Transcript_6445/g.24969 Transcript_6445/m.24969 type:complete len:252 (-) Transcript_6445:867-1622(-)